MGVGNRARGLDFLFSFCSYEPSSFGILWEVTHDRRKAARSDQTLERAQEGRGAGRRRTPHPDSRMLLREGQGEARGVMRARADAGRDGARDRHRGCGGLDISSPKMSAGEDVSARGFIDR